MRWCWILVMLSACEPTHAPFRAQRPERYTKLNEAPRPMKARADDSVTLYQTKVPEAAYVEVALIANIADNENTATFKLQRSAATIGCDGLVLRGARTEAVESSVSGPLEDEPRAAIHAAWAEEGQQRSRRHHTWSMPASWSLATGV